MRALCHNLSHALDMSKKIAMTSRLSLRDRWISWMINKSWLIHESPDWLSDIKLFSAKNSTILAYSNLSRISLLIGSNATDW